MPQEEWQRGCDTAVLPFHTRANEDTTEKMRLPHSRLHCLCDMYSDVTDREPTLLSKYVS